MATQSLSRRERYLLVNILQCINIFIEKAGTKAPAARVQAVISPENR
jgi:hypothetical protein